LGFYDNFLVLGVPYYFEIGGLALKVFLPDLGSILSFVLDVDPGDMI